MVSEAGAPGAEARDSQHSAPSRPTARQDSSGAGRNHDDQHGRCHELATEVSHNHASRIPRHRNPMYTADRMTSTYPPEHFLNRELSLLQFQRRVLAQAADADRAAARAPALPVHRFQQPRRILRDPRLRHQGADPHRQPQVGRGRHRSAPTCSSASATRCTRSSPSSTRCSTTTSCPRSRRKAWSSCAAACGPRPSATGSTTISCARSCRC